MTNDKETTALDSEMSRRGFVRASVWGVGLAYFGAIGYPIYRYLNSPVEKSIEESLVKEVTLKDAGKLAPGTALVFKFGVRPALLIHHDDGTWVALDAVCSHLGCTVKFDENQKKITCACHGGVYDAKTGDNISGPPPRPLTKYVVSQEKEGIKVSRA
jgi:cytochrome b6-f complex iron-sulfur subunit